MSTEPETNPDQVAGTAQDPTPEDAREQAIAEIADIGKAIRAGDPMPSFDAADGGGTSEQPGGGGEAEGAGETSTGLTDEERNVLRRVKLTEDQIAVYDKMSPEERQAPLGVFKDSLDKLSQRYQEAGKPAEQQPEQEEASEPAPPERQPAAATPASVDTIKKAALEHLTGFMDDKEAGKFVDQTIVPLAQGVHDTQRAFAEQFSTANHEIANAFTYMTLDRVVESFGDPDTFGVGPIAALDEGVQKARDEAIRKSIVTTPSGEIDVPASVKALRADVQARTTKTNTERQVSDEATARASAQATVPASTAGMRLNSSMTTASDKDKALAEIEDERRVLLGGA